MAEACYVSAMIRLGPFQLEDHIGQGGMGAIWQARHVNQDLPAAVKVLHLERASEPGFERAFIREVRAVSQLHHPNIVEVYDHGLVSPEASEASGGRIKEGTPYLAMELVPGGNLAEHRGRMPWPMLRGCLLDLLSALAHAHSKGVIHRDIKPGNVLLRPDDTVKLTDFGLAHGIEEQPDDRQDVRKRGGTPAYMAPEQLRGEWRDLGPWTDLYALGCLAWAMATGGTPYVGQNWVEVMHGHLAKPLPELRPTTAVPHELEGWLHKLLRKSPEARFRRAADAAWALLRLPEQTGATDQVEEPGELAPSPLTPAVRTTMFWEENEVLAAPLPAAPSHVADDEDDATFDPPRIPRDWRRMELGISRKTLMTGLGLYGVRSNAVVGRTEERDALWEMLHRVERQRIVHVAWIHGPPGSGKSRLGQWLCERAHEVGAATPMVARHSGAPKGTSGLRRMVSDLLGTEGMAREAALERIGKRLARWGQYPEDEARSLTSFVMGGTEGHRLVSPRDRHALLAGVLARMAEERLVVLWLDDAHLGPEALGLAEHLVMHASHLPVLILLSGGDGMTSFRRQDAFDRLMQHPRAVEVALGPLSPVHTSELVRDLLGLQGELADQVLKRVNGNPMFAVQLVGDWVSRGLLEPTHRGYALTPGATIHLPDSLHEVWTDAVEPVLEQHGSRALLTLELGAAFGVQVRQREWQAACSRAGYPRPDDLIAYLERANLIRIEDGWCRLPHAMFRESLERTAREAGRWPQHHAICAETLLDLYPEASTTLSGRLGGHLLAAGNVESAMDQLLKGAQASLAASEYSEALDLLDRRDRALEGRGADAPEGPRIEGWLLRALTYLEQGRPHLARAWAERAERATRDQPDTLKHAWALNRLATVYRHLGKVEEAERRFLAALNRFREAREWAGVGECLQGLGAVADRRGRYDRARELLEEARAAYAAVNTPIKLAQCIDELANAHRKMGNVTRARLLSEEALARYEGLGSPSGIARAACRLAVLDLIARDPNSSELHWRRALYYYEQAGDPMGQAYVMNGLAEAARFRGEYEQAEVGYRRALQIGESLGTGERLVPLLNLALIVLRQHRFSEARVLLEDAANRLDADGRTALCAGAHIGLVACAAAADDMEQCDRHFRLTRKLQAETGMVDADAAWPAELAGDLLRSNGREHWSRACYELALKHWQALGFEEDAARVKQLLIRSNPDDPSL